VKTQGAPLQGGRLRAALPKGGDGGLSVVAEEGELATEIDGLRRGLKRECSTKRLAEWLMADVPASRPGADEQLTAQGGGRTV
jgi:hypothetical protein